MKRMLTVATLLMVPGVAWAQPPGGPFGIGVGGGTGVSGISGKYHMGGTAVQGVVGWEGLGSEDGGFLGASVDFLNEQATITSAGPVNLDWNYGVGVNLGLGDGIALGASFVLGLEVNFQPVPLDLVIEYRPGLSVIPDLDADLTRAGAHIRYYF